MNRSTSVRALICHLPHSDCRKEQIVSGILPSAGKNPELFQVLYQGLASSNFPSVLSCVLQEWKAEGCASGARIALDKFRKLWVGWESVINKGDCFVLAVICTKTQEWIKWTHRTDLDFQFVSLCKSIYHLLPEPKNDMAKGRVCCKGCGYTFSRAQEKQGCFLLEWRSMSILQPLILTPLLCLCREEGSIRNYFFL